MPPAKDLFANRYTKRTFGNKYHVQYDTIVDHDLYDMLRVSFEVPRETPDTTILYLNGKAIGTITVVRNSEKAITGFNAERVPGSNMGPIFRTEPFTSLKHAAAAIITNYV
jgi:hypothetical protein